MNLEDKLNKIKEQNRARSARYYAKKKANKDNVKPDVKPDDIKQDNIKPDDKKISVVDIATEPEANTNIIRPSINDIIKTLKARSIAPIYFNNFIQLIRILEPYEILRIFEKPEEVIKKIEAAKQANGKENYSINSKKSIYQTILYLIDNFFTGSKNKKMLYLDMFEKYKILSLEESETKNEEKVYNFDTYLNDVKTAYGEDSKENIIANLFRLHGFRDNLKALKIIDNTKEDDSENNFIYVNHSENIIMILMNNYKTKRKYKEQYIMIQNPLKQNIFNYIKNNKLHYGDFLFGETPLIKYIINFNKKMGYDIGINTYRHMLVSIEEADTPEDKIQLSKKMNHSTSTSKTYKRRI